MKVSTRWKIMSALLLGAVMAMPAAPASAIVLLPTYNFSINGSYTVGEDPPITGTLTVLGDPTDTVTGANINGGAFGIFTNIVSQGNGGGGYEVLLEDTTDTYLFALFLDTKATLFAGQPTTISANSLFERVDQQGPTLGQPVSGSLAISSTPLPSSWLMLLSAFAGLGFFAYRGAKKNAAALAVG